MRPPPWKRRRLASVARHPDFFAETALGNRAEQRLAGRPANLPVQFIDLTPWFNGKLDGTQTNSAKPAPGFDAPVSLSPDETSTKLAEVANLSGYRETPRSWEKLDSESISKLVRLEAGKRYFIEVLHKEGNGGDHVSVAWRKAGEPPPKNGDEPIGAEFLQRPAE